MNYPSQASHTLCNIYGILQGLIDHKNVKNKLDEAKMNLERMSIDFWMQFFKEIKFQEECIIMH